MLKQMGSYSSFDELYWYWRQMREVQAPFYGVLLSTESVGLDKAITDFVTGHLDELHDMSGQSCWMFTPAPRDSQLPKNDIVYSVGRLLHVMPEQFPSIVFFDNLIRPKQTVIVLLAPILGSEPTPEELLAFFRTLFTLTENFAVTQADQRLPAFQKAVNAKWKNSKDWSPGFVRMVDVTLSISEIVKNVIESLSGLKP
jgi:hypothetical protein